VKPLIQKGFHIVPGDNRKVTMTELARLANVNIATVSRALNGSPLVNAETRERIIALAAEVGYVINATARNLRRQSSEALGVIIPMPPDSGQGAFDPFFLEMAGALAHAATARGFDLLVSVPGDLGLEAERRLLLAGRVDGLIVLGQAGRTDCLNALGDLAKKVVVWGGEVKGSKYTLAGSDNRQGGRLATEHLFSVGRRRLLFLGNAALPEIDMRYAGFLDAHAARGIAHDPQRALPIGIGGKGALNSVSALLSEVPEFDGIVAASDMAAVAAMQALAASGRNVPGDVSVAGYDNISLAALTAPGLTTIDQNIRLAGQTLVELLLQKLDGQDVHSRTVPTGLVIRGSSVPHPERLT